MIFRILQLSAINFDSWPITASNQSGRKVQPYESDSNLLTNARVHFFFSRNHRGRHDHLRRTKLAVCFVDRLNESARWGERCAHTTEAWRTLPNRVSRGRPNRIPEGHSYLRFKSESFLFVVGSNVSQQFLLITFTFRLLRPQQELVMSPSHRQSKRETLNSTAQLNYWSPVTQTTVNIN